MPLARHGYLTLAIDLAGHGQSGGSVPRSQLDGAPDTFDSPAAHAEIDAAIGFLKQHPLFNPEHARADFEYLGLVGHSHSGWAAASVGYRRTDVAGVVSIGAAPASCDLCAAQLADPHRRPGKGHFLGPLPCGPRLRHRQRVCDPGRPFGDFGLGTARRLLVVNRANHFTELADPAISRRVVQWLDTALATGLEGIPGGELLVLIPAVLLASLGGGLACTWTLARAAQALGPQQPLSPRPGSLARLAVFFLLLAALVPLLAAVSGRLEVGPIYGALPAVILLASTACTCLAVTARSRRSRRRSPWPRTRLPGEGSAWAWRRSPWASSGLACPGG